MSRILIILFALLLGSRSPSSNESDANMNDLMSRKSELKDFFHACSRSVDTPYASLIADAECFTFERLENPDDESSILLPLKGMVLPSIRQRSLPDPVVILVGGPGQAATEAGLIPAQLLSRLRESRDIVLLDQRGTGQNSPFNCDFDEEELTEQLELFELIYEQTRMLDDCLEQLAIQNVQPEYYTTDLAINDLEALREFLGYSALNLWGGSYGTRVALAYLQAFPDQTRTVVIDSVAPPSIKLPLYTARDASAALELIFAQCEQDESCNEAFPTLRRTFQYLLQGYQRPLPISFRHARTNENDRGELSADSLKIIIRSLLYGRETDRLIPLLIQQLSEGNYQTLAAISSAETDINQGMFLSVVCNEDFRLITDDDIEEALNNETLLSSEYLIAPVLAACEQWPKREVAESYFEPVVSDKPVLIFSGTQDPVTPPVWGDLVGETLSNSRHFVSNGMAHISLPYGCVGLLVAEFIENESSDDLDGSCLENIKPRPFFLNVGGSASND